LELNEIKSSGIEFKCVGGGRIQHDTVKKEILVYGHSYGFGRADHEMSVSLIKHKYSNYGSITFSNEGY
jgi:phosphohistidine phosphatase